ncbi:MAG: metallophosphoesterase N-terminal domain-containing protein, partial [Planctomycetaceae bacterium]
MSRLLSVLVAIAALSGMLAALANEPSVPGAVQATGIVYHDVNGNRTFDAGDRPLPGVRVSNGHQIVATDGHGRYELPVDDDTILFVIKPRGWKTPLNEHSLPQFFYVHKPHGSPPSKFAGVAATGPLPESVNFPLMPQNEPQEFQAILFGDTQPRDQKEVDWIAHDVIEELMGTDASFGVTLGDIVFDDLAVMQPLNRAIALLGIPWYNVLGNHDINLDAPTRRHVNETFERVYGPSYYSFDYGPVHFLVLDNIEWKYDPAEDKGDYTGGIGPEQLAFIKTDLAQIPEDQLVVLMMHIPLRDVGDRHDLYRLIERRPFCISISAHHHVHEHVWVTHEDGWQGPRPHHHIINVTVCGSWWSGAPDERGIPHTTMADGAPNGYSIMTFNGT